MKTTRTRPTPRSIAAFSAAIAVVLSSVLTAGAAYAAPESAGPAERSGWTRSAFIKGAQEVGGLSASDAARAWADPNLFARTVVREKTYTVDEKPVLVDPSQVAGTSKVAAVSQKTFTAVRQYFNPVGIECMALRIKKTFRYDGVRAFHDASQIIPYANGVCGFHIISTSGPTNQYGSIGGIPNSVSITNAILLCQDSLGSNRQISLYAEGRYNGVTNSYGSTT